MPSNSKTATIDGLVQARGNILAAVRDLPPAKFDEVFLGSWSLRHLLAHLIGWDYANAASVREIRAGQNPKVFKHWNPDWRAYNAQLVKQYANPNTAQLLQTLRESHGALLDVLRELSEDDFDKDFGARSPRGKVITIAEFLQAEIEDEQQHAVQIRQWLERTSR